MSLSTSSAASSAASTPSVSSVSSPTASSVDLHSLSSGSAVVGLGLGLALEGTASKTVTDSINAAPVGPEVVPASPVFTVPVLPAASEHVSKPFGSTGAMWGNDVWERGFASHGRS
ncbi:hypothetical protein CcaverHIS002_0301170 [Cutaneotrichosporon cavernicola]|uniref:Uncharacterized protein n=1 Tax=Cutaneotrichosporon cavernicola TaxID=279322 RepID=A0AA48IGG1_9TREE|nr:uncharacterized protein CcaverHIS019_0301130 [Cutaneotrichosporon cavernicola]BEI82249.1 hypothetical protein CcaverHIS002_0301170 [Cutaneotrichosporon cavernicola]BEI90043.1 hypothetical protein CcaverHIS019_0301130 [Cutaneotrichosporon cavernicola]BEI97817.1 hypothetical protein CcaverHIS631_0301160 [Cutaneotrichosporon cavernicola]BEJ05595.1 hypothetical protein CcaverHIS641_0301170 [Cutaneotrichosporon cavernicola]